MQSGTLLQVDASKTRTTQENATQIVIVATTFAALLFLDEGMRVPSRIREFERYASL